MILIAKYGRRALKLAETEEAAASDRGDPAAARTWVQMRETIVLHRKTQEAGLREQRRSWAVDIPLWRAMVCTC
jgi:hypothetical protein